MESGATQKPKRFDEVWLEIIKRLATAVGQPVVKHATLSVAVFAGALYLAGVIRTMGILHAENISLARGLPIVPLQDYLLRGLAVVVTPQILVGFGFVVLGTTLFLAADMQRAEQARLGRARESSSSTKGDARHWLLGVAGFVVTLILALVSLVPVAEWLPIVPAMALTAFAGYRLGEESASREGLSGTGIVRYVAVLAVTIGLAWGLRAYWNPPPLENVRMTDLSGTTRTAKVLLDTGETLYVVGRKDQASGNQNIRGVPLTALRSIEISDGPPRTYKTVPELLGIRFWRLWEDESGGRHFERSPP